MKTSCVAWPERTRLVIIREAAVHITGGDHCAAALISFFEYWHNHRLEAQEKARQHNHIAEKHGEDGTQDTSLYQFHTSEQISEGLAGLYKAERIREGIRTLEELGIISVHKNPNPRYKFDNTKHFLFYPERVNELLQEGSAENRRTSTKNSGGAKENSGGAKENSGTIPKTTNEITYEKGKPSASPADDENEGDQPPLFSEPLPETVTPNDVVELWNREKDLTAVKHLSDSRRKKLLTRLKEPFFRKHFKEAIRRVGASDFCCGRAGRSTWRADFDWFLRPDTCNRVIEGKYDNRRSGPPEWSQPHAEEVEGKRLNAMGFYEEI